VNRLVVYVAAIGGFYITLALAVNFGLLGLLTGLLLFYVARPVLRDML
jgi:hypothetical protein